MPNLEIIEFSVNFRSFIFVCWFVFFFFLWGLLVKFWPSDLSTEMTLSLVLQPKQLKTLDNKNSNISHFKEKVLIYFFQPILAYTLVSQKKVEF